MNIDYIKNYDNAVQTTGKKREESRFGLYIKQQGEVISILPQEGFYQLFFLLEGVCEIREETGQAVTLLKGEFILLPADKEIQIRVKQKISLLTLLSSHLLPVVEKAVQDEDPNQPLQAFILTPAMEICCRFILFIYKEKRMPEIWEKLKERELFLLLKHDYNSRELSQLFRSVAGDKSRFRQKVKQYILQTSSITELYTLSGMKRTTFEKRFKKEFGNSPYKWILQKKSIEVKQSLLDLTLPLEEVRIKHGFNSASYFVRFCKRQLGMPPSALRKEFKRSIRSVNEIL